MSEGQGPFYRIVMAARPRLGSGSFSWRVKTALEARGHTVFWLSPNATPWVFREDGEVEAAALARFLEVQKPDCLLLADGVRLCEGSGERAVPGWMALGALCSTRAEAAVYGHAREMFDFVFAADGEAQRLFADAGALSVFCAPALDDAYASTPLVNDIAYGRGIVCLQDAAPDRVSFLRRLASHPRFAGQPIRCFGSGWPEEWAQEGRFSGFAYASRTASVAIVFDGGGAQVSDGALSDHALALLACDGSRIAAVGGPFAASFWNEVVHQCATCDDVAAVCDADPASLPGVRLEDELDRALRQLRDRLAPRGLMRGGAHPRRIVCVLGYFGKGNFGDEFILATLDRRLRSTHEGASLVAVSEDPAHTFANRGIYAISLASKRALDRALAHAAAALVVAGLLFDQGIRWTMGKAEMASSVRHTDIPGIAAYAALARMNGARPVFYGIGAGPLEVADSHALVSLIGDMGGLFIARDAETAALIRRCGVTEGSVVRKADTAFLSERRASPSVDAWLARRELDAESGRKLIALSLREYENVPEGFASRIAAALDHVAERDDAARFVFCILDPADRALADAAIATMRAKDRAFVYDRFDDVEAFCDLLSRCHAGLSMRYHCSLILNKFGKPCIGLDYLPKVASLYRDMGLADEFLLGMEASAEEMGARLALLLAEYDAWRMRVEAHVDALVRLSAEGERMLWEVVDSCAFEKSFAVPDAFFLRDEPPEDEAVRLLEGRLGDVGALLAERDRLAQEIDELKASYSFKVGSALMLLPSRLKRIVSHRKGDRR